MDADLLSADFVALSEPAQLGAAVAIEVLQARLDAARLRLFAAIDATAAADEKHVVEDGLDGHRQPRRHADLDIPDRPHLSRPTPALRLTDCGWRGRPH